jgi:hypothetical protein
MVEPVLSIIRHTIAALLAIENWRGQVRFVVHIDAKEKSVKVCPEVIPLI